MRYTRTAFSLGRRWCSWRSALLRHWRPATARGTGAASADLSRPTSAALPGDGRWLWEDRPACPRGERAVWVDRAGSLPKLYVDPRTGRITFEPGEPEFHGYECQPLKLRPV